MIAKSAAGYFFIRLFPAIGGFFQITLLVRGLGIGGYGEWAEVCAAAALLNAFFLQWVPKSISRYGDLDQDEGIVAQRQLTSVQFLISGLLIVGGCCASYFIHSWIPAGVVLIAAGESARECILETSRATMRKRQYAIITIVSTIYSTTLAGVAYFHFVDAAGVALFWGGGLLICSLAYAQKCRTLERIRVDKVLSYLKFGIPVAFAGALGQVAFSGTRLFISNYYGRNALGIFAAVYDLLQRLLVSYMQVVNSAAFPILRRAWDRNDIAMVGRLARSNLFLLAFPTFSVVGAVMLLWPVLNNHVGGINYGPWLPLYIGAGVIFNRVKTFHVDYFSILGGRTTTIARNSIGSMALLTVLLFCFGVDGGIEIVTASVAIAYLAGLVVAAANVYVNEKRFSLVLVKDASVGLAPIVMAMAFVMFSGGRDPYFNFAVYGLALFCEVLILNFVEYLPLKSIFRDVGR